MEVVKIYIKDLTKEQIKNITLVELRDLRITNAELWQIELYFQKLQQLEVGRNNNGPIYKTLLLNIVRLHTELLVLRDQQISSIEQLIDAIRSRNESRIQQAEQEKQEKEEQINLIGQRINEVINRIKGDKKFKKKGVFKKLKAFPYFENTT